MCDEATGKFKIRYNYAPRPKEEWLFVPVPDAGIPKRVVEEARQSLKDNVRKLSKAAKRFWELSGGILRCGECDHTLRPHTSRTRAGSLLPYYSCRSRYNTGPSRDCSNRKHLRADRIEEQIWDFVISGLLRDPERRRDGLYRLIENERANVGRHPERDAEFWSKKISEVEVERRGYHRLAVKGHMTDEELSAALSDLDETRETVARELEAVQVRGEALKRLEDGRDALMESYAGAVKETLQQVALELTRPHHRAYFLPRTPLARALAPDSEVQPPANRCRQQANQVCKTLSKTAAHRFRKPWFLCPRNLPLLLDNTRWKGFTL